MGNPCYRIIPVIFTVVILLGAVAFSCCLAAEFKKPQARDMKVDGNLCYIPRSPAFGLGISALVCLFIAQITGTTVAATRLCARENKSRRSRILSILFLALSWVSFGLAAILLGTASSMSNKQPYGKGWMKRECYLVKDGIYAGSGALAVMTVVFIISFTFTTNVERMQRRTGPDEERNQSNDPQQEK